MDPLTQLATLRAERAALDATEQRLIEAAREAGYGWATVAAALGLKSRQAAEQRLLRLSAAGGRDPLAARQERLYQRTVDETAGSALAELRRTVRKTYQTIAAQSTWDGSHARATLARQSLEAALTASPGSLYHLADKAIGDLEAMGSELADALRAARDATAS